MTTAPAAAVSGLGLGLSLIVAIGAQNAFVLRQGLRREHLGVVVAVCAVSDAVLIVAGVAGTGALVERVPGVVTGFRIAGGLFLLGYAALAARRAVRPAALAAAAEQGGGATLPAVLATTLALTWLNPHVYLDAVLLLGGVATTQGDQRWWFAAGAVTGSVLWFSALGYGARLLRPLFARPAAWRVLDGLIAVVMAVLGVSLLVA